MSKQSFTETRPHGTGRRRRWLHSPWLRPFNDVAAYEHLLGSLNPLWTLGGVRARVTAVVEETADTRSFVLAANRHWRGFVAGQHVAVEIEIDGVLHHRSYSLSSAPGHRRELRLTVKRQAGSRVSAWLHENAGPGTVLRLTQASGQFHLPADRTAPLLLAAAGSGITPLMAMLEQLHAERHTGSVVFLHASRDAADALFAGRIAALGAGLPGLRYLPHHSAGHGRLDAAKLAAHVPDFAGREARVCGPAGFTAALRGAYADAGVAHRIAHEDFRGGVPRREAADATPVQVRCAVTGGQFTAAGLAPLLVEAEAAGLQPKSGCRAGICRTCVCKKRSGHVENLLTGEISSAPDQWIQLCITAARSDLELDL